MGSPRTFALLLLIVGFASLWWGQRASANVRRESLARALWHGVMAPRENLSGESSVAPGEQDSIESCSDQAAPRERDRIVCELTSASSLPSDSAISAEEMAAQVELLGISTRSAKSEIERLLRGENPSLEDLITVSKRKRKIESNRVIGELLRSRSFFLVDQKGLNEIHRKVAELYPEIRGRFIISQRFLRRPRGGLSLVFLVDPEADPELKKARDMELALGWDKRALFADAFNAKELAQRQATYERLVVLKERVRTASDATRPTLMVERMELEPPGTYLNPKTLRMRVTR